MQAVRRACLASQDAKVQRIYVKMLRREIPFRYRVVASLPAKNYPPANIAAWIKECEAKGMKAAGQKIMDQWNRVIDKYPATRVNWGAAVKIGGASIKKNVFGGEEFSTWLAGQADLAPQEAERVKEMDRAPDLSSLPAIAIPKDGEQPEDWKAAADKTKAMLAQAHTAFDDAHQFIAWLKQNVTDLQKKIAKYKDAKTKTGAPSKYALRIPKWTEELNAYQSKIQEAEAQINAAERKLKTAEESYHTAPVTTVAFEAKAQKHLDLVLEHILNMEDLQKKEEMLQKFGETLEQKKKVQGKASDIAESIMNWIRHAWEKLSTWAKGLLNAVDQFEALVTLKA